MKRSPLRRKTPLRATSGRGTLPDDAPRNKFGQRCITQTCVVCGGEYLTPPSGAGIRRTCSRKCAADLKRSRGGSDRLGPANPNFKGGGRTGVRERAGETRWYAALGDHCMAPGCEGQRGHLALHHVCYRQHVRRAGGDVWDPRNAFTICASCHARHHRRSRILPVSCLHDSVFEFARDLFGAYAIDYLRRYYEDDGDLRLAALISAERAA